jgi:inner membrane protease subunit 1
MEPPPSEGLPGLSDETYHRGRDSFTARVAAALVAVGVAWACLRWRPQRVEIEGPSMMPTLLPGDWALAVPVRRFERGQVVVVEHPGRPGYELVKRITAAPGERVGERTLGLDEFWIEGDRGDVSTDSRHFGPVTREALRARILLVYGPGDRRRLVR